MTEIQKLKAELEKLKAENERLTNKVQSQHDYMAPKYDAAMAELEKLKVERDEAREHWKSVCEKSMDGYKAGLDKVFADQLAELKAKRFVESLDVVQDLNAKITRLTSQLEQAERVIAPFADAAKAFAPVISDSDWCPIDFVCGKDMAEITVQVLSFRAASQWIKDRQAKTDGEAS